MQTPDALLARLINHLAEEFKNQLILKGGMLLRLLNSPRATQDLDYVWLRTKKRNVFAEEIKNRLKSCRVFLSQIMPSILAEFF